MSDRKFPIFRHGGPGLALLAGVAVLLLLGLVPAQAAPVVPPEPFPGEAPRLPLFWPTARPPDPPRNRIVSGTERSMD